MAEKDIKMIYYISPEKTDHYVKKNRVRNYYYTPDEMDRIITDSAKNKVRIKIVGSIKLKTAVSERLVRDKRKYLCIDGKFYEIDSTIDDLSADGYFYLGDNMYLQYEKTKWFLPLYIIFLTLLLTLPAIINNSYPVKEGETKPVIIPDIDENPGSIIQPDGRPNDIPTITFTGYPKELSFNESNRLFYMNNDEVNVFYLKYTISDDSGNVIHESGYISPGCYTFYDMYSYIQQNGKPDKITVTARGYTESGEGLNSFLYDIKIN